MYHLMRPDETIIADKDHSLGIEATEFDDVKLGKEDKGLGFLPLMIAFGVYGMTKKPSCSGVPNFGSIPVLPKRFGAFTFNVFQAARHVAGGSLVAPEAGLFEMELKHKETVLGGRLDNIADQLVRSEQSFNFISRKIEEMYAWAESGGPTCQSDMNGISALITKWTRALKTVQDVMASDQRDADLILSKVKGGPESISVKLTIPSIESEQRWFKIAPGKWEKRTVVGVEAEDYADVYKKGVGWEKPSAAITGGLITARVKEKGIFINISIILSFNTYYCSLLPFTWGNLKPSLLGFNRRYCQFH